MYGPPTAPLTCTLPAPRIASRAACTAGPSALASVIPPVVRRLKVSVKVVTVPGTVTVCTSLPKPAVDVACVSVPVPAVTVDVSWGTSALPNPPLNTTR